MRKLLCAVEFEMKNSKTLVCIDIRGKVDRSWTDMKKTVQMSREECKNWFFIEILLGRCHVPFLANFSRENLWNLLILKDSYQKCQSRPRFQNFPQFPIHKKRFPNKKHFQTSSKTNFCGQYWRYNLINLFAFRFDWLHSSSEKIANLPISNMSSTIYYKTNEKFSCCRLFNTKYLALISAIYTLVSTSILWKNSLFGIW